MLIYQIVNTDKYSVAFFVLVNSLAALHKNEYLLEQLPVRRHKPVQYNLLVR
jgi:hypothetical protein